MPKRRNYQRKYGDRRYKKFFIISTEGSITEPEYFSLFNSKERVIKIHCLKNLHQSAPSQVLQRMKKHLDDDGLKATDEAWLVIDKDDWADEQISELFQWSEMSTNHGFALSNPKFEYWLLLHFEDGKKIRNSKDCSDRLKGHIPRYHKKIVPKFFTEKRIQSAIDRAENRDNPKCQDWPRTTGTTVYNLIKNILKGNKQ